MSGKHRSSAAARLANVTASTSTHPAVRAKRFASVVECTPDLVVICHPDGSLLYANAAARSALGLDASEWPAPGECRIDLSVLDHASRRLMAAECAASLDATDCWSGELVLRRSRGRAVPLSVVVTAHRNRSGQVDYLAAVGRDISERKGFEQRLAHEATHDALTGLPNRVLLLDRLAMAMARKSRHRVPFAVLFCDLDQFKVVNDSLGHDVGDRLLASVAERIVSVVRPEDTVARFGGDEFVVLCDQLAMEEDAVRIAERIAETLLDPIVVDGHELTVSTSVGIAFPRGDHERPDDVIRDADVAMYRAKERGRNRFEVFNKRLRTRAVVRLETERALRRAVDRKELHVVYQPKFELDNGSLRGFEALLRWNHPERGLLLPGEFITLAEETGMVVPIGSWVLAEACAQLQRWRLRYLRAADLDLSVNLSGRQLNQPDVVDTVATVLAATGLEPSRLVLEMTESVLMADAAETVRILRSLKALGVRLAVDDFGTGYSSLAYLRRFPVDVIKIDRAFIAGLTDNAEDLEIVRLVTTLARALGLQAVAEGVESSQQLDQLRRLGCTMAQGFHLAPPMSPAAVEGLLAQAPVWAPAI